MGGEAGRAPSGGLRSCACSRTDGVDTTTTTAQVNSRRKLLHKKCSSITNKQAQLQEEGKNVHPSKIIMYNSRRKVTMFLHHKQAGAAPGESQKSSSIKNKQVQLQEKAKNVPPSQTSRYNSRRKVTMFLHHKQAGTTPGGR